ncbi:MAG TPA: lysylphosphatidylglycerol synthase transmembrane domain-containing protein [Anaerolineales bacterium]|nr:lysylphosphatidylglycerol synthase transmembrane domain-containing protein [Anaerolineales bacterium]
MVASVRKFLIAIILMLGILFVIGRAAELESIVATIQQGDWRFLVAALVLWLAWLVSVAACFRGIYRGLGIQESIASMLLLVASANFVNVIAPSGGVGGITIFVAEARRRNYSPARAMVAGALYVLFDYIGFLSVLALGLIVLIRRNNLNTGEIVASAVLVTVATVLALLLYLGTRSGQALGRVLAWGVRVVNRVSRPFTHRETLSEQRSTEFANDAAEGLLELHNRPHSMITPISMALTSKGFLVLILLLCFLAFRVPVSVGTVIAGYSIAYLFVIVSPTPAGIGIVEGALTLSLTSMYIPLEAAALITLAYRGITFWLPLLVGMIAFRLLSRQSGEKSPEKY